jgi:hypothetical protein
MWIEIAVGISVLILFFIKLNSDHQAVLDKIEADVLEAKELADKELAKAKEDGNQKRGRIWERLDEVKTSYENKLEGFRQYYEDRHEKLRKELATEYVAVKMCSILHNQTNSEMAEIKARLDTMCGEMKRMNERLFNEPRKA